jgi:ubiquinone/menaquinone biosynthesis C-methylase UbiE
LSWTIRLFRVNRAAAIVDHADLQPGMRVLDFGCGPGRVTVAAARRVGPEGRVLAVEVQPAMLERAREKVRIRA